MSPPFTDTAPDRSWSASLPSPLAEVGDRRGLQFSEREVHHLMIDNLKRGLLVAASISGVFVLGQAAAQAAADGHDGHGHASAGSGNQSAAVSGKTGHGGKGGNATSQNGAASGKTGNSGNSGSTGGNTAGNLCVMADCVALASSGNSGKTGKTGDSGNAFNTS